MSVVVFPFLVRLCKGWMEMEWDRTARWGWRSRSGDIHLMIRMIEMVGRECEALVCD